LLTMSMKILPLFGMLTSLIRAWARSAYGRGAHGTAWLYAPCLVGIRLIERSLMSELTFH
jgi:hypothetical protein